MFILEPLAKSWACGYTEVMYWASTPFEAFLAMMVLRQNAAIEALAS